MNNKSKMVFILFVVILIFSNCETSKNPVYFNEPQLEEIEIFRDLPYLIVENKNSTIIFTGHDYESHTGHGTTDSEFDKIKFSKYNTSGEKIIDDKVIISSPAILKFSAVINENQNILMVWLDPRNNPNFKANYHPYEVDIYYKVIDFDGNILIEDTKYTNNLFIEDSAYSTIQLDNIYNGTLQDMKKKVVMTNTDNAEMEPFVWQHTSPTYWILNHSKNNQKIFKIVGDHIDDNCHILYSKVNSKSEYIINEKELIKYTKLNDQYWGPEIQKIYIEDDSNKNTQAVWQLNPGNNLMEYYYLP